jgi:hypothetical protein
VSFFEICQNDPVAYVDSHNVTSFVRHVPLKPAHVRALYFDDFHESQIDNKSSHCLYSSIAGLNISGSIPRILPKNGPSCEVLAGWTGDGLREPGTLARWRRVGDALATRWQRLHQGFWRGQRLMRCAPRAPRAGRMVKPFHFSKEG